jgi:creatinine amidohydrolase
MSTFTPLHGPLRWAHLSTTDFAAVDRSRAIAVLPVAATEQHGPHLPLSVDSDLADGIVAAAWGPLQATLTDSAALFLPTQTVGFSPEHSAFAGTLTLKAETLMRVWTELAECVAASGITTLLIFNTHGGQQGALDLVARDLRARLGMTVVSTSWYQLPLRDAHGQDVMARFTAHEQRFGVHAGQVETAMDRAEAFASTTEWRAQHLPLLGNGTSAKLAWATQDLNPSGAVGNAAAATLEDGHALLQAAGRALAQLVVEMGRLGEAPRA